MKRKIQLQVILWTKRALGFIAIILWFFIIYTISNAPIPFEAQAPYCMMSTMMVFGLLSLGFKGLEYWERQEKHS
jgi:peptidoglycan/LPS O-acetylase OafA/YrhL